MYNCCWNNSTDDTWLFTVTLCNCSKLFYAAIELESWFILYCTAVFYIYVWIYMGNCIMLQNSHINWNSWFYENAEILLSCCIPKIGDQNVNFLQVLHNTAGQEKVNNLFLKQCCALIFSMKNKQLTFLKSMYFIDILMNWLNLILNHDSWT